MCHQFILRSIPAQCTVAKATGGQGRRVPRGGRRKGIMVVAIYAVSKAMREQCGIAAAAFCKNRKPESSIA